MTVKGMWGRCVAANACAGGLILRANVHALGELHAPHLKAFGDQLLGQLLGCALARLFCCISLIFSVSFWQSSRDGRLEVTALSRFALLTMEFPERLAALRKERGMTQQALANQVGLAVLQIHRSRAGRPNLP